MCRRQIIAMLILHLTYLQLMVDEVIELLLEDLVHLHKILIKILYLDLGRLILIK